MGGFRFIAFFLLILLLVLIILIPKGTGIPGSCFCNWSFPNLRTFGEIRITTRVSNYCQRGGSLLLLMISLLKGTSAFWEGSCVFNYSGYSNCSNFLLTPTGTGALGKLKIHVWEMLSTHRRYYNDYSYSERGRCLLLSSRIMFVFQCF